MDPEAGSGKRDETAIPSSSLVDTSMRYERYNFLIGFDSTYQNTPPGSELEYFKLSHMSSPVVEQGLNAV